MNVFNCSKYLVNRATQAKKKRGILAISARKQRQEITEEAKLQVVSLYQWFLNFFSRAPLDVGHSCSRLT